MAYNKYRNIKTEVDGIKFDSLTESNYYKYLKQEKLMGRIVDFKPNMEDPKQTAFVLQEGYQLPGQRKQSAIKYLADFVVDYGGGVFKIIDTKGGATTPEFKLKKKLFEYKFKRKVVEVRWKNNQWEES